jgi:hypothetical protein
LTGFIIWRFLYIARWLQDECGGEQHFTPAVLLSKQFAELKRAGLSARKVDYLQSVATAFFPPEENESVRASGREGGSSSNTNTSSGGTTTSTATSTANTASILNTTTVLGSKKQKKKKKKKVLAPPVHLTKEKLEELSDDQVISTLCRIKGIGAWSAHMVLPSTA